MADLGRLGLTEGLKRFFDLRGPYQPQLGEGIVPTVQVGELDTTPFSIAAPWFRRIAATATAAEYGWAAAMPAAGLPINAWISIDKIFIQAAAGSLFLLSILIESDLPALNGITNTTTAISGKQPATPTLSKNLTSEVTFRTGTSVTPGFSVGMALEQGQQPIETPGLAFTKGGLIAVVSNVVNLAFQVSFVGRVHMTTAL